MTHKDSHKPKPAVAEKAVKVQPFSELLASAASGKALDTWNGMKVYVVDLKTGKVMVNVGGDERHDPASLTKLGLFYVAQEAIKDKKLSLSKEITITPDMARVTFSKLKVGEKMTISLLLDAMMIESDNGAARIISDEVKAARGGQDPVHLMNAAMKRLGLKDTHFINAGGLPAKDDETSKPGERKTTTAKEMASLIGFIHRDFKDAMQKHMTEQTVRYGRNPKEKLDGPNHNLHQANHFLLKPGSPVHVPNGYKVAAKTGRTNDAGNVIVALITAPDGRQLISVVFAPKDINAHVARGIGVPEEMIKKNASINGNRPRDTLVHQLTEHFIGTKSREVAITIPAAPAAKPEPEKSTSVAMAPHAVRSLPASAQKAVAECKKTLETRTRPGPESEVKVTVPPVATTLAAEERELAGLQQRLANKKLNPKERKHLQHAIAELSETIGVERKFLGQLNAIENQADASIYTKANYDAVIARTRIYLDAFVDSIMDEKFLPPGGKPALKQKFYAIADGSAGKETGWNPDIVKGSANRRPHTGVYQTEWAFIHDAGKVIERNPAMKVVLDKYPDDARIIALSKNLAAAKDLPTTSFAGQPPAFAAMTASSFVQHVNRGGKPADYNGAILYDEHMMGGKGARDFREQLATNPHKKGDPGVGKGTYNGNYLVTKNPYAHMNDLNPNRIVYSEATAKDVQQMMHDKSVHAYNRMVKKMDKGELPRERVAAFEQAFLPEWTNNPNLKAQDIARVIAQKEMGLQLRADAEAKINALAQSKHGISPAIRDQILCEILKPMTLPGNPARPTHATQR